MTNAAIKIRVSPISHKNGNSFSYYTEYYIHFQDGSVKHLNQFNGASRTNLSKLKKMYECDNVQHEKSIRRNF